MCNSWDSTLTGTTAGCTGACKPKIADGQPAAATVATGATGKPAPATNRSATAAATNAAETASATNAAAPGEAAAAAVTAAATNATNATTAAATDATAENPSKRKRVNDDEDEDAKRSRGVASTHSASDGGRGSPTTHVKRARVDVLEGKFDVLFAAHSDVDGCTHLLVKLGDGTDKVDIRKAMELATSGSSTAPNDDESTLRCMWASPRDEEMWAKVSENPKAIDFLHFAGGERALETKRPLPKYLSTGTADANDGRKTQAAAQAAAQAAGLTRDGVGLAQVLDMLAGDAEQAKLYTEMVAFTSSLHAKRVKHIEHGDGIMGGILKEGDKAVLVTSQTGLQVS